MKTPNPLDDWLHVGLFAVTLCLVAAVIASQPDLGTPQATARAQPAKPSALNTTPGAVEALSVAA